MYSSGIPLLTKSSVSCRILPVSRRKVNPTRPEEEGGSDLFQEVSIKRPLHAMILT